MASEYRINVYESEYTNESAVVGRVRYNADLDYWDGRNFTNGGTGRHKGIAKLKNGQYVIINGTQWQGEKDTAYIVTDEEALQEILKSGNSELLETKKFKNLKKLMENNLIEEMEEEE